MKQTEIKIKIKYNLLFIYFQHVNDIKKGCENLINVKELKLKKIFNLKEYLQEKARRDKEYEEYVNASIERGLQDIKEGRIEPLDKVLRELEEEFGLEHYE